MTKAVRKTIMKRSELENKYVKNKTKENLKSYTTSKFDWTPDNIRKEKIILALIWACVIWATIFFVAQICAAQIFFRSFTS